MKKILFAMAALAALASCQKVELAEQNSVNTNGERVITAYFDNAGTKTTLDENGITPKWAPNDKIMLLNETSKEEITLDGEDISSDGKSVTITTTLGGTIYAVYPSNATSAEKVETANIVPVTLSAENQDGTFASANICVAKENDGSLAFKNVTSVLHLTQTASTGVNEIIITTPSAYIAGTGTVDMSETTPTLALSSGQSNKIKVKSESVKTDYYIAVAPTTLPVGTAFGFATGSELGGTNLSDTKTIAANTIYNIGSMDASAITPNTYHAYVEINGLKWATMNIGAASATDAGTYFAWGDIVGQTWSGTAWSDVGFSTAPVIGDPETLPLDKDAANVNWGGSWRMPTNAEFDALGAGEWVSSPGNGRKFGTSPNTIFLPAAGYGYGSGCYSVDDHGYYWSSSLYTDYPSYACRLYFYDGNAYADNYYDRCYGHSVRALSE